MFLHTILKHFFMLPYYRVNAHTRIDVNFVPNDVNDANKATELGEDTDSGSNFNLFKFSVQFFQI